jgi:hypothetical protein
MKPHYSRRRILLGAAAVGSVAALTLTACGTNTEIGGTASNASSGGGAHTLTSITGRNITLPSAGAPTAVFFFSVGCGECAGGVKSLGQAATVARRAGSKAGFLAVDADPGESPATIKGFLKEVDAAQVPTVIDTGAAVSQRYQVAALSTLIVVDGHGKVTYRGTDPSATTITSALRKAGA